MPTLNSTHNEVFWCIGQQQRLMSVLLSLELFVWIRAIRGTHNMPQQQIMVLSFKVIVVELEVWIKYFLFQIHKVRIHCNTLHLLIAVFNIWIWVFSRRTALADESPKNTITITTLQLFHGSLLQLSCDRHRQHHHLFIVDCYIQSTAWMTIQTLYWGE